VAGLVGSRVPGPSGLAVFREPFRVGRRLLLQQANAGLADNRIRVRRRFRVWAAVRVLSRIAGMGAGSRCGRGPGMAPGRTPRLSSRSVMPWTAVELSAPARCRSDTGLFFHPAPGHPECGRPTAGCRQADPAVGRCLFSRGDAPRVLDKTQVELSAGLDRSRTVLGVGRNGTERS
jgi:hypothetical protein